jgi:hypothetical protein
VEFWQAATNDGNVIAIGRNGSVYYTETDSEYKEHFALGRALDYAYVFYGGPTPQAQ